MRKMVVWGGILGGSVLVFLALTVGVLIWGVGILRDRLPTWVDGGEKIVSVAIMKAEEILPGVKEQAQTSSARSDGNGGEDDTGHEIPERMSVGRILTQFLDIANMIRVSYSPWRIKKGLVSYKGKVDFGAAKEFYRKEMLALGFQEKALRASPAEEVYQFKKGDQEVEVYAQKNNGRLFGIHGTHDQGVITEIKRRFGGRDYLVFSDEVSFSQV